MRTHIALLRGINVGGNNKVKMAELRAMLEDLGYSDPATLLQSGNVVFGVDGESNSALEKRLRTETHARLGVDVDYFVRTAQELDHVIDHNPFPDQAENDPSHLLVVFLHEKPLASAVTDVATAIQGPEKVEAVSDHIFVLYPVDIGNSKVSRTPGWNKLVGVGTGRNWNTLVKLQAMLRA